jgi:hypothetical protein
MRLATLGAVLALVSALSFGESFTGKLVDASCAAKAQVQKTECAPTAATKSFAIETADGKVLKLDSTGNSKAIAAMKDNFKPESQVTVSGQLDGQTVKVDSIDTH